MSAWNRDPHDVTPKMYGMAVAISVIGAILCLLYLGYYL